MGIQVGGKEKGQRVVGAAVMTENLFGHPIEAVDVAAAGNSLVVACEEILNSSGFEAVEAAGSVVEEVETAAGAAAFVGLAADAAFAVVALLPRAANAVVAS